jgi:putative ABC transport system permease protein
MMHRYVWGQLRNRGRRPLALLVGIVVATTSFTVLTGTAQTSRLRIAGTVTGTRPAYDILVRPKGSTIGLERSRGLVRENHLSGIFGGITLRQYAAVRAMPSGRATSTSRGGRCGR